MDAEARAYAETQAAESCPGCKALEAKLAAVEAERPCWLWRGMLNQCAKMDCFRREEDGCEYTGDCITEWCTPCAARAFRKAIEAIEEPKK